MFGLVLKSHCFCDCMSSIYLSSSLPDSLNLVQRFIIMESDFTSQIDASCVTLVVVLKSFDCDN